MNTFSQIIITDIKKPITVQSSKDRKFVMINRTSYGLSFCKSGQITYKMKGKDYVSDKSHAVLLPKGATYSLHGDKEGLFPVINFNCLNLNCDTIKLIPLKNPDACIKEYEKIKSMFLFSENRLKIFSAFYDLLDIVTNQQRTQQNPLSDAVKYIEENISDYSLSNIDIANHIGISEVYFRKKFHAEYNTTPKQFILNKRIEKAKQMLIDTQLKITDIAEQCGFSSLYHFCRAFKEKTGFTPTQFSKQNKVYKI